MTLLTSVQSLVSAASGGAPTWAITSAAAASGRAASLSYWETKSCSRGQTESHAVMEATAGGFGGAGRGGSDGEIMA